MREYLAADELVHEPVIDAKAIATARAWLFSDLAQVEEILVGMPSDEQERYRRDSRRHNTLAAFDTLARIAEAARELDDSFGAVRQPMNTDEWLEFGDNDTPEDIRYMRAWEALRAALGSKVSA